MEFLGNLSNLWSPPPASSRQRLGVTREDLFNEKYQTTASDSSSSVVVFENPNVRKEVTTLYDAVKQFKLYSESDATKRIRDQHVPPNMDYLFDTARLEQVSEAYNKLLQSSSTNITPAVRSKFENVSFVNIVDVFEHIRLAHTPSTITPMAVRWDIFVNNLATFCKGFVNEEYVIEHFYFSVITNVVQPPDNIASLPLKKRHSKKPPAPTPTYDIGGKGNHIYQTAIVLKDITPDEFKQQLTSYHFLAPDPFNMDKSFLRQIAQDMMTFLKRHVQSFVVARLGECYSEEQFERTYTMSLVCSSSNYGALAVALFCACAMYHHVLYGFKSFVLLEVAEGYRNLPGMCMYQKFGFEIVPHMKLNRDFCFTNNIHVPMMCELTKLGGTKDATRVLDQVLKIVFNIPETVFTKHMLCGIQEVNPYRATISLQQVIGALQNGLHYHECTEDLLRDGIPCDSADEAWITLLYETMMNKMKWKHTLRKEGLNSYNALVKWIENLLKQVDAHRREQRQPQQPQQTKVSLFQYLCTHISSPWLLIYLMSDEYAMYHFILTPDKQFDYLDAHENKLPPEITTDPIPVVPVFVEGTFADESLVARTSSSSSLTRTTSTSRKKRPASLRLSKSPRSPGHDSDPDHHPHHRRRRNRQKLRTVVKRTTSSR